MDYKKLIMLLRDPALRDMATRTYYMYDAADAIETLLAERDAAVEDLKMIGHCKTCGNITPWCADNPDSCDGYVWRGTKKESGRDG